MLLHLLFISGVKVRLRHPEVGGSAAVQETARLLRGLQVRGPVLATVAIIIVMLENEKNKDIRTLIIPCV